jgi:hypothetical protein
MAEWAAPDDTRALIRPELIAPPPRDLPCIIDIWGAGRAVRAMLTVAALQGSAARFRIWCRHHSRAELLRIHLADLPPLDVAIHVAAEPPAGGAGPLVLALGLRTSRRSRQKSKDALFDENLSIIEGLLPALKGRTVIVVTNPSTRLTARLCGEGINALGIGVMNDQLRFERDGPASIRLVGAHNPFELGFGRLGFVSGSDGLDFNRAAYRDLTNQQDRQRPLLDPDGMLARWTPGLHEAAWQRLGALHGGLDVAKRWYARQRLASRYLENGIACGRAMLVLADFLTGMPSLRPDLTVEAPMRLADGATFVVGWPWDSVTGLPRALAFDTASRDMLSGLGSRYAVPSAAAAAVSLMLRAPGMPTIRCAGVGLEGLVADVAPLAHVASSDADALASAEIEITVVDDPASLPAHMSGIHTPLRQVAQHRGKNAFEHRDLTIQPLPGNRRLLNFSASGARALIDDDSRQITLAVPPGPSRRDEFRKLLRDQILTPAYAAAGAWVLHAGLVSHDGAGLLLLGDSGAGKTTGALHLLAGGKGGYGASERVLVFVRDGRLMALGVPESLTIFRGSLRGLPGFADLLQGHDPAADWTRAHKLRLSRDDVVARLGSHQIAEPIPVSHVALVRYLANAALAESETASADMRHAALLANDLTTEDDVRAAWLEWYQPSRDPDVVRAICASALPFRVIDWSQPAALATMLAEFATKRL